MANLLADILSFGNTARRKLGDLISAPAGVLQMNVDRVMPTQYEQQAIFNEQAGRQANPVAAQNARQKMDQLAQDAALNAITVYHGSPHKFDKFDMSKIGTGEGAQAYGHGLYFAEAPEVAGSYAANLTTAPVKVDGVPITSVVHDANAQKFLQEANGNLALAKERAKKEWLYFKKTEPSATKRGFVEEAMKQLDQLQGRSIEAPGALYKVDLPDEAVARFLDWDKPLSQQAQVMNYVAKTEEKRMLPILAQRKETLASLPKNSPQVEKLKKQIAILEEEIANPDASGLGSLSGGDYYNYLRRRGLDPLQQASEWRAAGIPGIRYLDGGSRGTGTGTSNFVVFDDTLPTILERNGIPLSDLLQR